MNLVTFLSVAGVLFAAAGCSGANTLTDSSCGTSIEARVGQRIDVSLGSTYWSFEASSDPAVMQQDGSTQIAPAGSCVPGGGCGTADATFDAVGAGHATIKATRIACGEALGCGQGQGQGICTIRVTVSP
jgi:hypothetical protein